MEKAAVYTRVASGNKRDAKQGHSTQKQVCELYAQMNGYEIVKTYSDTGLSGIDKQPNFWQMVRDAEQGGFQFVIVKSLDRVTRQMKDCRHYIKKLDESGIKILCTDKNETANDLMDYILRLLGGAE